MLYEKTLNKYSPHWKSLISYQAQDFIIFSVVSLNDLIPDFSRYIEFRKEILQKKEKMDLHKSLPAGIFGYRLDRRGNMTNKYHGLCLGRGFVRKYESFLGGELQVFFDPIVESSLSQRMGSERIPQRVKPLSNAWCILEPNFKII